MIIGTTTRKIAISLPAEQVAAARQAVAEGRAVSVSAAVPLGRRAALRAGTLCAAAGTSDVVDASVALCARERGQPVVTTDPGDLRALDPSLVLVAP